MNLREPGTRALLEAEEILERLTVQQFVWPHRGVKAAVEAIGVCPLCGERALVWLGVDGETAIGRLRRTELTQLARASARLLRVKFHAAAAGND